MDGYQGTLLGAGEPCVDDDSTTERIELDAQSWVDVTRTWLLGADTLLAELVECIDWRQGRRRMYDRMLDDPRLCAGTPRASAARMRRCAR